MLELTLKLQNNQVTVYSNGKESHRFILLDLSQSNDEWKGFFENPRFYGEKLFNSLFTNDSTARLEFDALSKQSERTIVLALESPELDDIAWEYAYNKTKEEYVVEDCAFVRALPESERPANGRFKASYERVSLLFIPANPLVDLSGEPMRALDEESEWREITKHIIASNAGFDLLKMLPATPEQLQTVMAQFREGLIVHFSGHGATTKDGAFLLFERENGASNPLDAREFVREIKDKTAIAFLSACQSAVAEKTEFSNLARELVKAGVPFALGMQFNLPDSFAPDISGQFYNYITRGHGVPEAARQARRAVKREYEFFVGMIALYVAHPDETGSLIWNDTSAKALSTFRPGDVSDLPAPASGLIGRQRELMRIGTQLLKDSKPLTVTLHGGGGIGKTALLWQVLLRFTPSFELTLAIALDTLPSLESVLGRIERSLGLPSPCENDIKGREVLVSNVLTSKRTLLGLDNFETLNYALNEKSNDEEKTAKSLHAFFRSLAANGVTLCVTSREVTSLPGETIEDIQGLSKESGGRLFQENVVKQKAEIYIEKTQQISELVGGHPLALRLLASAFEDQLEVSLDEFIEKLQFILPKIIDKWSESERLESLRASFNYAMKNFSNTLDGRTLRTTFSRLSSFVSFFSPMFVAYAVSNKWNVDEGEESIIFLNAEKDCKILWERGLLVRIAVRGEDGQKEYLYQIHPATRQFVEEIVEYDELLIVQSNYFKTMMQLAYRMYPPANKDNGMFGNFFLSSVARFALPDMINASRSAMDHETSTLLFHTAFIFRHSGNTNEAMRYYQKSLGIKEYINDFTGKSTVLTEIAEIHTLRGEFDTAVSIYEQIVETDRVSDDLQGMANTYNHLSNLFRVQGNITDALQYCYLALELHNKIDNLQSKSAVLYQLAELHCEINDFDAALNFYQQVLNIVEMIGNLQGRSAALRGIANIYVVKKNFASALEVYETVLIINDQLGDLQNKSLTLHEMAGIYVEERNFDKALDFYQKALDIDISLGGVVGQYSTLVNMGVTLLYASRHTEALEVLLSAFDISNNLQIKNKLDNSVSLLKQLKEYVGEKEFTRIWGDVADGREIPDWLVSHRVHSSPSAEKYISDIIRSVRENRPEMRDYWHAVKKMSTDPELSEELRELGKVLEKIMLRETNVDLSYLPESLRGIIEKHL